MRKNQTKRRNAMRKQLSMLVLLSIFGYTLIFSCGALAAENIFTDYSSSFLGNIKAITNPPGNLGGRATYCPFDEIKEGDNLGGPPPCYALAVNFGGQGGLWYYKSCMDFSGWSKWTIGSPNLMVSTGYGVVANFPSFGLYESNGTNTWTLLTPNSSVENVIVVADNIYADFGSLGLWQFNWDHGGWAQITVANPDKMQANGNKLLANFPGDGLYQYDGATWTQLTPNSSVENLLAILGVVYADFGSLGLWEYHGEWINLSYSDPNMMQAYGSRLVANFPGYGLYEYYGIFWTELTPNDTVEALIEVSGNLYADYGPQGLWKYNGSWTQLTSADANLLSSYGGYLVANFPVCGGLYQYSEYYSSWAPLTDNIDKGVMGMVGLRAY
jgi:hypothetical protein